MKYKFVVTLLFLAGLLFIASTKMAYSAYTTKNYGGLTLNSPWTATHWNDVWDLTQGDLTLSYTIDMTGLHQPGTWYTYDGSTSYTEVGLRGEGASDFNPGPWNTYQGGCGGWMVSDDDTWNDGDGHIEANRWIESPPGSGHWIRDPDPTHYPAPNDTQDLDDTHGLQCSGGRGSRDYDVLLSAPNVVGPTRPDPWDPTQVIGAYGSHDNYGFWFDRDGVDPWQDEYPLTPGPGPSGVMWGAVNGSTYNTTGIYDIVITYHAINSGLGVMFATVNGIQQGCYDSAGWKNAQPEYYPVGLSFKGDMKHMQVFAGLWAPDASYGPIVLSGITVAGWEGSSDPLVARFTYAVVSYAPSWTVQFTDTTHGGMPPYTYSWDFNNDGVEDSNLQNPTWDFLTLGDYMVTLKVTPYRCVPKSDPVMIHVGAPPVGGEWAPVDAIQLLVRLVGSIVATSALAASFVAVKRIKRKHD